MAYRWETRTPSYSKTQRATREPDHLRQLNTRRRNTLTANDPSLNTPQIKSPANATSKCKRPSTSYETAHNTQRRAVNISLLTATFETSRKCSHTRSAFNRCYGDRVLRWTAGDMGSRIGKRK